MNEQQIKERFNLTQEQFDVLCDEVRKDLEAYTPREMLLRFWATDSVKRKVLEFLL